MYRAIRLLKRRNRGSARDQRGMMLVVVLIIVLAVSLLVVALLGLAMTTSVVGTAQHTTAKQLRAADAALDSAINQIAHDRTGNLGFPFVATPAQDARVPANGNGDRDCSVPGVLDTGEFRGQAGVAVSVTCEPIVDKDNMPSMIGVSADDTVRVIGKKYEGELKDWNTSPGFNREDAFKATVLAGQTTQAQVDAALAKETATIVHQGSAPLSLSANVDVREGAAGFRTPPITDPSVYDSAIAVTGLYRQGNAGLLHCDRSGGPSSCATGPNPPNTNDPAYDATDPSMSCGILQPLGHAWKVYGAALNAGAGATCTDAVDKTISWETPGITPGPPVTWVSSSIASFADNVPSTCPGGSVINFPQTTAPANAKKASYNKIQTARLNSLLSGSCKNKTFVFAPGDYWFDVDDAAGGAYRHSILIKDPTAKIVFGQPSEATITKASFPEACRSDAAGVTITLSARTSIRHEAGRVAICGRNGRNSPAIWQGGNANLGWIGAPTTASDGDFSNASAALVADGNVAVGTIPCVNSFFQDCDGYRSFTVGGLGAVDPGPAAISSVQVLLKAAQGAANDDGANVRINVTTHDDNPTTCFVQYTGLPEDYGWTVYELLDPVRGNCAARLTDRSQLVGAEMQLQFYLRGQDVCIVLCIFGGPTIGVDAVKVRVPWTPTPSNTGADSTYGNPQGALKQSDGAVADRTFQCARFSCADSQWVDISLTNLQDLSDPDLTSTAPPGTKLTSAGVVVRGNSDSADAGDSQTKVTITGGSIPFGSCFVQVHGIPDYWQGDWIDLLDPTSLGNCSSRLTSATQLLGATLKVSTYLDRNWCPGSWLPPFCSSWGEQLDYIGISTTSAIPASVSGGQGDENGLDTAASYDGPDAPFLVTSNVNDAATGSQPDAMFSVYGQVSLPRADLDVHWDGPNPMAIGDVPVPKSWASQPIFHGGGQYALTVNGIGSIQSANGTTGVLCCAPAKPSRRHVQLRAWRGEPPCKFQAKPTDGNPCAEPEFPYLLATAIATISDQNIDPDHPGVWTPGQKVTVEDWQLCRTQRDNVAGTCVSQ